MSKLPDDIVEMSRTGLENWVMSLREALKLAQKERDTAYKRGWNDGWDAATEAHLGDPPISGNHA